MKKGFSLNVLCGILGFLPLIVHSHSLSVGDMFDYDGFHLEVTGSGAVKVVSFDITFSADASELPDLVIPNPAIYEYEYWDGSNWRVKREEYEVVEIGDYASQIDEGLDSYYMAQSIIIPNSVKRIGNYAFSGFKFFKDLIIGEGVTYIGEGAFYQSGPTFVSLAYGSDPTSFFQTSFNQTLHLGKSVQYIGERAFAESWFCNSLVIPNSVTYIGDQAFLGCFDGPTLGLDYMGAENYEGDYETWLFELYGETFTNRDHTLTLGANVEYIGENAFASNSFNGSLLLGSKIKKIGSCAFSGNSFQGSLNIPASVTSLSYNSFDHDFDNISVAIGNKTYDSRYDCNAIIESAANTLIFGCNSTKIPSSIKAIGEYACSNCKGLTELEFHTLLSSIGTHAFSLCSGITKVTFNNELTSIGDYAFYGCSSLEELDLPHNLMKIGKWAFRNCSSMVKVSLPNSLDSIGEYAFYDLNKDCVFYSSILQPDEVELGASVFGYSHDYTLYVPQGTKDRYLACDQWKNFKFIIDASETVTGDVDGSAMVDVDDVNAMINLILFYDQYKDRYPGSADLDGNGMVDVDDVNAIINIILAQ